MSKTLEDYLKVISYVEDDLVDLTSKQLDIIFDGLKDKVDAYYEISEYMKGRASTLKERANELLKKSRALENAEKNLKRHMAYLMSVNDCLEIQGNHYTAKVRTSESVVAKRDPEETDATDYPLFVRQKIIYEWDKTQLKIVLKDAPNLIADIAELSTSQTVQFRVKK